MFKVKTKICQEYVEILDLIIGHVVKQPPTK
jgi:uncharacterized FlaG/YvyC family protein